MSAPVLQKGATTVIINWWPVEEGLFQPEEVTL